MCLSMTTTGCLPFGRVEDPKRYWGEQRPCNTNFSSPVLQFEMPIVQCPLWSFRFEPQLLHSETWPPSSRRLPRRILLLLLPEPAVDRVTPWATERKSWSWIFLLNVFSGLKWSLCLSSVWIWIWAGASLSCVVSIHLANSSTQLYSFISWLLSSSNSYSSVHRVYLDLNPLLQWCMKFKFQIPTGLHTTFVESASNDSHWNQCFGETSGFFDSPDIQECLVIWFRNIWSSQHICSSLLWFLNGHVYYVV